MASQRSGDKTKLMLAESLRNLMRKKPLDKIKIHEIVDACGVNRQTFYYHFPNIIDLVEWILYTDAERLMQGNKTYDTWQKGYLSVFKTIEKDKSFILNVYHHAPREYITSFLYTVTQRLLLDVVKEKAKELRLKVKDEDILFVADFFKYSLVGIVLDWIDKDMQMDATDVVKKLDSIIHGTMEQALRNAAINV